jgi:surfactin synthase thioesterase subunit
VTWLTEENFESAWRQLLDIGVPLRDRAVAWADLQSLRATYGDQLERLIDFLVAPRGFWGHSAEATVAQEVAQAASEARRSVRSR